MKQENLLFEDNNDLNPSEVHNKFWIHAYRKEKNYPAPTENNGKWLVFVKADEIDYWWQKIKPSVEEGKLGSSAKVSTSLHNSSSSDSENKVICIYTYDWTDVEDVKRVRQELRNIGINWKIPYKSDRDTLQGKYRVSGHRRISKYYE